MIAKNAPIELIAEYTETSIQEIANLIKKITNLHSGPKKCDK